MTDGGAALEPAHIADAARGIGDETGGGAGGGRKAPPELSDRHAAIADKAGAAARRGWARQSNAGHCSIPAAESYLEAGRLLQALARECSRGELMLAHRRAGMSTERASHLRKLAEACPDAHNAQDCYLDFNEQDRRRSARATTDGGAARVEPAHIADAARGIGDEMGKIALAIFFGRPFVAPDAAGPTIAARAAVAISDAMGAIADDARSPADTMAQAAHAIADAMKEIADDAQSPSDTAARAARAIADEIRKMADEAQSPSGAAARATAAAARNATDVANMLYVGSDESRSPTAARAVRAIADEMSKIADAAGAP